MYIVTDKFTSGQGYQKYYLKKKEKFCGIYFCDGKNLGTFAALIFAI